MVANLEHVVLVGEIVLAEALLGSELTLCGSSVAHTERAFGTSEARAQARGRRGCVTIFDSLEWKVESSAFILHVRRYCCASENIQNDVVMHNSTEQCKLKLRRWLPSTEK